MKILVTGAKGQLGYDVCLELDNRKLEYIGVDKEDFDICDEHSVQSFFENNSISAVVHCAAWTDVEKAEDPKYQSIVYDVNCCATKIIANQCYRYDIPMLYVSTDYVFNKLGIEPISPEYCTFSPLNYYGKSKLDGEIQIKSILKKYFIVRTSWVFGLNGNNFVKTMLRIAKDYNEVNVISDQVGSPTYTKDLAVLLVDMIISDKYGVYHATNEGCFVSWYDFCCAIYQIAGIKTAVIPILSKDYSFSKAKRPLNSRLDKSKLSENGFKPLPQWTDALSRYLCELI